MEMYNSVCYCVEDRSTINQVLALIRHFECRLSDANHNDRHKQPYTADCLQESGIFEEDIYSEAVSEATQTESPIEKTIGVLSTDLTEELRKLSRIREKIEERKVPLVDDRVAKELSFYKEHWRTLERKIEAYESVGDDRAKLLTASVDRELRLSREVKHLYATVEKLKEQNRLVEEEKCEFEEAENDTRLQYQKYARTRLIFRFLLTVLISVFFFCSFLCFQVGTEIHGVGGEENNAANGIDCKSTRNRKTPSRAVRDGS